MSGKVGAVSDFVKKTTLVALSLDTPFDKE
jgi:hypothetical protein